jgi:anti-anti-sigma factor
MVAIAPPMHGPGTTVEIRRHGDVVFVSLSGELDAEAVPQVSPALTMVYVRPPRLVVVDLGGVTFMGSAGVGVLAHLRAVLEGAGGRLRIGRAAPCARRMLDIVGWTDAIDTSPEVTPV